MHDQPRYMEASQSVDLASLLANWSTKYRGQRATYGRMVRSITGYTVVIDDVLGAHGRSAPRSARARDEPSAWELSSSSGPTEEDAGAAQVEPIRLSGMQVLDLAEGIVADHSQAHVAVEVLLDCS